MKTTTIGNIKKTSVVCLVLFILILSASFVKADQWQGWRGLEKQACSDSIAGPVDWTSTRNVLWKVEIGGEGHSSPVASDSSIFVTAAHFDDNNMNFKTIFVIALLISSIIFILLNFFPLLKNLLINRNLSGNKFISELPVFSLYGFLIFAFCIMTWMYFVGDRTQPERILTNYLFSGSVFFLCLLLLMTRFPEKSTIRVIVGLIVIILVGLIVKYIPRQNYYTTSDLFKSWIVLLMIPAVILPLLFSIILIFKTIFNKYKSRIDAENSSGTPPLKSLSSRFMIISVISAFLLGISGFLAVPVITVAKVIVSEKLTRVHEPVKFSTFINPDFAYPFFLGVLIIGFLLWLIIEPKKQEYNSKKQFYFNSVLLCCSVLFFIMNNFGIRKPEYRREILCIDRNSGIIKWKKDCLRGPAISTSTYNTQATPTPLIHDYFVYAYFGSAGFVSADFEGNIKWENTNLPSQSIYGVGASPIFCSEGIIILNSTSTNPYLTLLDFNSGKQKWKTELKAREGSGGEYRTPLLVKINGQELIIEWSFNRNELALYEANTGKVKYMYKPDWSYEGESVTTPVFNEGIIYLANRLNIVALDILKLTDGKSPVLWKTELKGKGPDTPSPVLGYGMIFMISDNGFVKCLNSETGEILWQEKLRGTYFSSPIITGKKVYFSNISGVTTVLECSPHFKKVAENHLPEGIYSTLVPVDGQLFVRSKNTLWCLKGKN